MFKILLQENTAISYIGLILFIIFYAFLIIFLLIQLKRKEKVSHPFIISLTLYFVCDLIGNLVTYPYYRITRYGLSMDLYSELSKMLSIMYFTGLIFTGIGPIYLIYNLEKSLFHKKILQEKHLITKLQLVFSIIAIALFIGLLVVYDNLRSTEIEVLQNSIALLFVLVVIFQGVFFFFGFLFLGMKSTGEYRTYPFIIVIGWAGQAIVNLWALWIFVNNVIGTPIVHPLYIFLIMDIIAIIKLITLSIMAYGFLKLYSLSLSK